MMEVKVQGLKELDMKLAELTRQLQTRALRQAVNAGAQIVKKAARAKVPIDTGLLRREIIAARSRRQSTFGRETFNILIRQKTKKYADTRANRRSRRVGKSYKVQGDAFYWRFVEFGTKHMAARPFLRPALANNQQAAINAIREKLAAAIQRAQS
jgi:HK97 gp10 family phage protein